MTYTLFVCPVCKGPTSPDRITVKDPDGHPYHAWCAVKHFDRDSMEYFRALGILIDTLGQRGAAEMANMLHYPDTADDIDMLDLYND